MFKYRTAWDLFKNEYMKKHFHLSSEIACCQASTMWKTLSQKELEKYKKKHKQLKDKYMTDYQLFLQVNKLHFSYSIIY